MPKTPRNLSLPLPRGKRVLREVRDRGRHRHRALIDRAADIHPLIGGGVEPTDREVGRFEVSQIRRGITYRHRGGRVELRAVRAEIHFDVAVARLRDGNDRVVVERAGRNVKFELAEIKRAAGACRHHLRDGEFFE